MRSHRHHLKTPLIFSNPLSKLVNKRVYLKLDLLQPSGSFKDRGMGALLEYLAEHGKTEFVSSSGGNAGLAAATVANQMNFPIQVIVPQTTNALAISKIRAQNAAVSVIGENWNEADVHARQIVESGDHIGYIHPFSHPTAWEGHSTVIDEIQQQWSDYGETKPPGGIVCSVGGGGLLNGVCIGLDRVGWKDTTVVTAETIGCHSFYASFQAGEIVTLDKIESIATTLGARAVNEKALDFVSTRPCSAQTVTDTEAVRAVQRFLDDHRMLVEPSCSASLALLYEKPEVFENLETIVVEVCGGSGINKEILEKYKNMFGL